MARAQRANELSTAFVDNLVNKATGRLKDGRLERSPAVCLKIGQPLQAFSLKRFYLGQHVSNTLPGRFKPDPDDTKTRIYDCAHLFSKPICNVRTRNIEMPKWTVAMLTSASVHGAHIYSLPASSPFRRLNIIANLLQKYHHMPRLRCRPRALGNPAMPEPVRQIAALPVRRAWKVTTGTSAILPAACVPLGAPT